ncbi:hypothetical protein CKM354_001170200 [Cercospora kikuchii]|uniref:Uncharacterized protein n=1 Tax=Cercospora kikuchii TaxID=84275 RepID=A0A9P3CXG6_9PEZI|nr:uncharacterized protein CKM354_001170200 [Cercospora kikuchii]GIZ48650.1 hypothetical protein CKM354_001170200 [Cercospora kikuchii]
MTPRKDQSKDAALDGNDPIAEQKTTECSSAVLPPDESHSPPHSANISQEPLHQPRASAPPISISPVQLDPATNELPNNASLTPETFSLSAARTGSQSPGTRPIRPRRLTADQSDSDLAIVANITPIIVDYLKHSSKDFDLTLRSLAATLQKMALEAGESREVQESSERRPLPKEDVEFAERLLGDKEGKDTCWGLPWGGN